MTLAPGTRLGEFEVLAPLGKGGMGEVYRARDTRLGREVAVKVLPAELAHEPERLTRFEREAKVLGSLNHPNIATLHGFFTAAFLESDRAGQIGFLVMELVEGETLADRIARGPLPWRDAVALFEGIADGLKAAHESGIVHRDLKPANVKIDREGRPKILDFGLARAALGESGAATAPLLTHSPTLTAPATMPGVLLGTAAYMSPEQARGLVVDRRADVWAFGSCLYEALTGRRAFEGEDISLTLAAILSREPEWQRLPPDLPAELATLLRRCLEKDARRRLQDLGDARWWLAEARRPAEQRDPVGSNAPRARGRTLAAILGLVALASTAVALWLAATRPDPASRVDPDSEAPSAHFRVEPGLAGVGTQVAVHPSGSSFVFSAIDGLYRHDLADGVARLVPDTFTHDRPHHPFLSSAGDLLGFMFAIDVQTMPVTGGLPQHLVFLGDEPAGVSWRHDRIVFGAWSGPLRGLWWVPPGGGDLARLGDDAALATGAHPSFVEGRDAILFTGRDAGDARRPKVYDLSSGTVHDLGVWGSAPRYLRSGHLLWERDSRVWAAPFDLDGLRLAGDTTPVIDLTSTSQATPSFAASANGTLVTVDGAQHDFVEVAADGSRRRLAVPSGELSDPRLSTNGRFLAYTRGESGSEQVWIHELATGREIRISEARRVSDPVWTPGGDVVYLDRSSTRFALRLATPGRGGEPLTLLESDEQVLPFSVSPDGMLLFTSGSLGRQIRRLDIARPQHAEVWLEGIFLSVMFSPDGRWVAYERWSGDAGSRVYVRSLQGGGGERPVSVKEGWSPMWAPDGRTLYFKNLSGLWAVAAAAEGEELDLGSPRAVGGDITAKVYAPELDYTPTHDGEGFIVVAEAGEPRGFTVITNLGRLLRDRARAAD